jgi:hypothetical protein
MVHAVMGSDFNRLIMSMSRTDSWYCLWEKEQAVVLLSRMFTARDLIFVGDRVDTIKALASLIQVRSQYTEFISHLLQTLVGQWLEVVLLVLWWSRMSWFHFNL